MPESETMSTLLDELLSSRILLLDGAMGTTIRSYGMKEADMRGERFADVKKDLLNNGDLFSLTQPKMICDIHRRFLEAGADIIVCHLGLTTGGAIGARTAMGLEETIPQIESWAKAARGVQRMPAGAAVSIAAAPANTVSSSGKCVKVCRTRPGSCLQPASSGASSGACETS